MAITLFFNIQFPLTSIGFGLVMFHEHDPMILYVWLITNPNRFIGFSHTGTGISYMYDCGRDVKYKDLCGNLQFFQQFGLLLVIFIQENKVFIMWNLCYHQHKLSSKGKKNVSWYYYNFNIYMKQKLLPAFCTDACLTRTLHGPLNGCVGTQSEKRWINCSPES